MGGLGWIGGSLKGTGPWNGCVGGVLEGHKIIEWLGWVQGVLEGRKVIEWLGWGGPGRVLEGHKVMEWLGWRGWRGPGRA